ncbi:glycosyltransferase family 32 protein [Bacteroides fragilis]
MIPKTIHYCWFGGKPLPPLAIKCLESWNKYLPDYEIIEWNESNFPVNSIPYTKEAAAKGKWAFVSDYARFYILYHNGGIYLDTDVQILKSLNPFLKHHSFSGFESKDRVAPGLIWERKRDAL